MTGSGNRVLIVDDGFFHPPLLARWRLRQALGQEAGIIFERVRSLDALPGRDLHGFQALVLYYHHKTVSPAALQSLDDFLASGGGVLAVHSATASFDGTQRYFELLGGSFSGHGPLETFTLQPAAGLDPGIAGGDSPASFTVTDELYRHDFFGEIQVQYTALLAGEAIPVVWLHPYGRGLVCYYCPGHTAATLDHPAYQALLRRGLRRVMRRDQAGK